MSIVIYPGSFDPITFGHLDIVQRAARMFDRVIIAVANNYSKTHLFSQSERKRLVEQAVVGIDNVEVDCLSGLLVEYVSRKDGDAILRGLRALSDFEFEFQLALTNRKLKEEVETIFMMPKDIYTFLSSKIVKEIARLGGDIKDFVPQHVEKALIAKIKRPKKPFK
jgi:pantetheine-phosphate adenylyltransferase